MKVPICVGQKLQKILVVVGLSDQMLTYTDHSVSIAENYI